LYAPSFICNIFGQPSSSDSEYRLGILDGNGGTLIDKDGNRAGLIERTTLFCLRLHGQRGGWSSLDADQAYVINALWCSVVLCGQTLNVPDGMRTKQDSKV
jgi:hypothetical protein